MIGLAGVAKEHAGMEAGDVVRTDQLLDEFHGARAVDIPDPVHVEPIVGLERQRVNFKTFVGKAGRLGQRPRIGNGNVMRRQLERGELRVQVAE